MPAALTPEQLAAARARLATREGSTDLIEAQRRAAARVPDDDRQGPGGMAGFVGDALAKIPAAVAALAERVTRPKRIVIQEADVKPLYRGRETFAWNEFTRHCREVISKTPGLGLRDRTLMAFIDAMRGASGGKGVVRMSYEWVRGRAVMCFETISRCTKALEDLGLLEVLGPRVIGRSGKLVRSTGVYLPRFQSEIPEPSPEVVADRLLPLAKQTLVKTWVASFSGLFVRPQGLNSTPLRADRGTTPAPA